MMFRLLTTARSARRMLRAGALAAGLALAWSAGASSWLLAAPDPRVEPGETFEVVVLAPAPQAAWPGTLAALIELPGGARIALDLDLAAPDNGEASSLRRRYFGRWPVEVHGVATLSLRDKPTARLLVDAAAHPRTTAGTTTADAPAPASAPPVASPAPAPPVRDEPLSPAALDFHEPIYLLVGGGGKRAARFQLSFRYRLFDDQGLVAEAFPVASGLYFGFTQTSLWDLSSDSKPFRDSSFRPSLFYQWRARDPASGGWLALSGGYEHESNGRDGEDSRSIDTLFVRAEARHYLGDGRTYLGLAPKFWVYLDKEDNPDIARYRGYGELGVRFGRDDGLILAGLLRRGTAGKESTQLDLSYPIQRSIFSGVGAFVHLQYFKGYGETLLDYDERHGSRFRIGLSIVR